MAVSQDRAPEPGTGAHESPPQARPHPGIIDPGPRGDLVWGSLRETWLTHNIVNSQETHVKGGYHWDASTFVPVLLLDEDGDPFLAFAKQ